MTKWGTWRVARSHMVEVINIVRTHTLSLLKCFYLRHVWCKNYTERFIIRKISKHEWHNFLPKFHDNVVDTLWLSEIRTELKHDDVIKWKHFPIYWPFVRESHRSPVDSPHESQWRRALIFSLICAQTNSWANNRDAGNLRRHYAYYDVIVMRFWWHATSIQTQNYLAMFLLIMFHEMTRLYCWLITQCDSRIHMMTSSNGNIFRVTGHLRGEFTGDRWIPRKKRPVTRSFDVFFDPLLNKRLSKQSWRWWFETPSLPIWRHCNE